MNELEVCAVQCPTCGDLIFSRAPHDFRSCSCLSTHIDGGREYTKVGYAAERPAYIRLNILNCSQKELYSDWNKNINKYGLIKTNIVVYGNNKYTLSSEAGLTKNEC